MAGSEMNELPPIRPLLSTWPGDELASFDVDRRRAAYDWVPPSGRPSDIEPALQNSNVEFLDRIVRTADGVHARPKVVSVLGSPHDVRVLIVDDCALHRECLAGVLVAQPGVVAVGVA